MLNLHARRFVGTSPHLDACREGPVREFPGDSAGGRDATADLQLAGTVLESSTHPYVVLAGAIDLGFEPLRQGRHVRESRRRSSKRSIAPDKLSPVDLLDPRQPRRPWSKL
jgi:hypothetical protein